MTYPPRSKGQLTLRPCHIVFPAGLHEAALSRRIGAGSDRPSVGEGVAVCLRPGATLRRRRIDRACRTSRLGDVFAKIWPDALLPCKSIKVKMDEGESDEVGMEMK